MFDGKLSVLAPLRGVTIRCFRETYAAEIAAAGFDEAVTPFISAMPGVDPLKDRELRLDRSGKPCRDAGIRLVPQFIGKDPAALSHCLAVVRDAGWRFADLNCGCPFPMVRNKGRGSGLMKNPETLEKMLKAGCETMGEGRFSVKTRLGVDSPGELLALMDMFNSYPLRYIAVHARTARQMYGGECDLDAFRRVLDKAEIPVVYNGEAPIPSAVEGNPGFDSPFFAGVMCGRAFIRSLGLKNGSAAKLEKYAEASLDELRHPVYVLGRLKELVAYWKELPRWRTLWPAMKISRTLDEFLSVAAAGKYCQIPSGIAPNTALETIKGMKP